MTDITCRLVVMKEGLFFTGIAVFANGTALYRFSPNAFDAKAFKTEKLANQMAKRIKGCVKMFDALNGEMI